MQMLTSEPIAPCRTEVVEKLAGQWAERVFRFFGNSLFFLMLFMPRTYAEVKAPFLAMVVICIAGGMWAHRRVNLHPEVFLWFAINLLYGTAWTAMGALRGNEGILDAFRLNVVWVVLYAALISGIRSTDQLRSLLRTMIYAGIAISLYNIMYVGNKLDVVPDNPLLHLEMGQAVGIAASYMKISAHNIGTLAFLFPFAYALLLSPASLEWLGLRRGWLLISFVLMAVTVLISGRRVLWVIMGALPVMMLLLSFLYDHARRRQIWKRVFCSGAIIAAILFVSFSALEKYGKFDLADSYELLEKAFVSEEERPLQYKALMEGFERFPLVGSGLGAGVNEVVRDTERPWSYELSYVLILYNTGIMGMLLFIACVFWVPLRLLTLRGRTPEMLFASVPLILGLITFLVANATNPYFASYDFMWTLFLPVALINLSLQGKLA